MSSLITCPAEILLEICRVVLPPQEKVYDASEKKDLLNLRLACKTILPHATEVFFQHYNVLLWWTLGKDLGECHAFRLISESPTIACLVKSLRVSFASFGLGYDRQRWGQRM
jgi:hypothetical protein